MTHALDAFAALVQARFPDGDTVVIATGKVATQENRQQRTIILTRQRGQLTFSAAPGRQPFGTPTSGAGTYTVQRFQRNETIECTLRAADENALDTLLDEFVNAVFEVAGPNAFDQTSEYAWVGDDSVSAGEWVRRNPAIKLYLVLRLSSFSLPGPYAVVGTADADVSLLGTTDSIVVPPTGP